jgi:hypothetical protein
LIKYNFFDLGPVYQGRPRCSGPVRLKSDATRMLQATQHQNCQIFVFGGSGSDKSLQFLKKNYHFFTN